MERWKREENKRREEKRREENKRRDGERREGEDEKRTKEMERKEERRKRKREEKMYPAFDFRTLIHSDSPESAVRSISREPFPELLKYWKTHHRSQYLEKTPEGQILYSVYAEGIEQAVAKERYPCFLLNLIIPSFVRLFHTSKVIPGWT